VTSEESDVAAGKISTTSPIGRALLNKKVGDLGHGGYPQRRAGDDILMSHHHPRRGPNRMTWTSAVRERLRQVAAGHRESHGPARISPNFLTFLGLVIDTGGCVPVRLRQRDNQARISFTPAW